MSLGNVFCRAVITRVLFIVVALVGIWRVTHVKKNHHYWILTLPFLALIGELIVTLKSREGKDYKWFSLPVFLFLISIIPSIWILQLHHHEDPHKDPLCKKLNSWDNLRTLIIQNKTQENQTFRDYLEVMSNICSNDWILGLHQVVLILLIVGKWILPLGNGLTRDNLSQLLLIFVGTAADILEFTSETLSDVNVLSRETSPQLVYTILGVWTWSMLQFPFHLAVANNVDNDTVDIYTIHSTDFFSITEALFLHDGPFLVVRLIVMAYYNIFHQMLLFFTIKNFLVFILSLYRLVVICQDFESPCKPRKKDDELDYEVEDGELDDENEDAKLDLARGEGVTLKVIDE